jgi:hypothetical protein
MKRISLVFCLILAFGMLFSVPVRSQPTPTPAAETAKVAPAPAKTAPQLTKDDWLEARNFVLEWQQDQTAIDQLKQHQDALRTQYLTLRTAVETEFPGYTLTVDDKGKPSLVEKPKTPEPAKTDKK